MLGKYPVMPDNVYLSGKKGTTPMEQHVFYVFIDYRGHHRKGFKI